MLPALSIIHPLVDACSIGVLAAGGITWQRVIAYNAIAFALQLPLGAVLDEFPRLSRAGFLLGVSLAFAAAVSAAFGAAGWCVLAAACIGNALFHLTAGKHVLEAGSGRSGPIGLFISTGALGLMAGQLWAERAVHVALPVFAAALAVCTAVCAKRCSTLNGREVPPNHQPVGGMFLPAAILAGLFALIAWRSWAAIFAGGRSAASGAALMGVAAAVTWAGKAAGGYLAERAGRWRVTAVSVCGSALLAFACSPENAAAWLTLLFVAQLATGPVLSLVYERMGGRGGTAFGFNCLGLFAGSMA